MANIIVDGGIFLKFKHISGKDLKFIWRNIMELTAQQSDYLASEIESNGTQFDGMTNGQRANFIQNTMEEEYSGDWEQNSKLIANEFDNTENIGELTKEQIEAIILSAKLEPMC